MRRTKEQVKQAILQAILSSPKVIKTSEIMRRAKLSWSSVVRYKDEVYYKHFTKGEG